MFAVEKLKKIANLLNQAGFEEASKEAEEILCFALNIDRIILYRDNPELKKPQITRIDGLIKRRLKREPLQYIFGEIEFCGLIIKVGKGVLIPRPETELLAEEAIKVISNSGFQIPNFNFLDLCCGSGCIALTLGKSFPDARVYAVDLSKKALRYAEKNAKINYINNVILINGYLFEPLENKRFNLIISNPPYIKTMDIEYLQPEIRLYEPAEALDGGNDGLRYYREILAETKDYLLPDGIIMLEVGDNQSAAIKELAQLSCFKRVSFKKDYSQRERIAVIS